jgi:putative ATP-dependent endonuclease of the OLD family
MVIRIRTELWLDSNVAETFCPARSAPSCVTRSILATARLLTRGFASNIFVGKKTLEIDLLPAGRDAMLAAYGEVEPSGTKLAHFARDLDAYIADRTKAKEILDRITRVGKGRFAQRLAAHADSFQAPIYLRQALSRLEALTSSE